MSLSQSTSSYALTVQSIDQLYWVSSVYSKFRGKLKPNLFVEVFVDHVQVARTKVIKGSLRPVWGDTLTIPSATESSIVVLKLQHSSFLTGDSCFGFVRTSVSNLLRLCGKSDVVQLGLRQSLKKAKHDAQGLISVGIKAMNADEARENLLKNAQQDIERGNLEHADSTLPAQQGLEDLGAAASENKDLLQSLGTVLDKIQVIAGVTAKAVDVIAKVHPYADAAWKVISLVYKAYQHQKETDANVVSLFEQMAALYSFVDDLEEGLPNKIKRLERTIVRVLEKTTECGEFFREYTERGFIPRLLGQATSDRSRVVSDLSSSLGQLQEDLNSGVMLQTAFESSQTREVVERFVKSNGWKGLDPANMDTAIRASCLSGTRQELLKNIHDWLVTPPEGKNVLWLYGAAGLGKSTLANSIAEHFRGRRQQGAFLFFDRNAPLESTPARVIRTLAYQLAEHHQAIKSAISSAVGQNSLLTSGLTPLNIQFTSLLTDPLSAASPEITGPVIIVLDALDECGDAESRRVLLSLLSHELAKFPRQFRFLITSRPDSDIARSFNSAGHMHAIDLSMAESSADVLLYIKHEMAQIYSNRHSYDELPTDWPGLLAVQRLAAFAAGLFIWAATAMKFLRLTEDPVECLSSLLAHDREVFTLDELYKTALLSASGWKPGKVTDAFRQVLGLIVIGQIPLTDATISELLGFEDGRQCRIALRRLGCVIQWSEGKPARTLHKSFPDYLTDRSRCSSEPWFVDVQEHHRALTIRSFHLMKSQLRFNICNLRTSHLLNKDVPDLAIHVQNSITESLSYACRFWMDHLDQTPTGDNDIASLILEFFEHQFLYWLEVLSLLQQVSKAALALNRVKSYAMNPKSELHVFAQDGISFVRTFTSAITESVPHIYLSCIPFAPRSSILRQRYSNVVPKTLVVQIGLQDKWPPCQQVIAGGFRLDFLSVAFSPDGQRVASGSGDGTIRIWDAESGALKAGPFTGHTQSVNSMAFSPDGQYIASGSSDHTIRVWDAESGALKVGPLRGHTGNVNSVAFSPDGLRVASGSDDKTIRVWDVKSGALKAGQFRGHTDTVSSVALSPDGQRVASGSDDRTIRVWDVKSGALKAGPFTGHTQSINSVAFSPDGHHVASGSDDKSMRIWDVKSGAIKAGSFRGHTDNINSVAFSPDGQRVASGSDDRTIRVWDVKSGALKARPFTGHTSHIHSVAFSPDQRIVSCSADRTIRIWDAESGVLQGWSLTGHTNSVPSVVFSPDGQRVASGSIDGTVCVWDAESGALKVGPFTGHTSWVESFAFSADGQRVASGSADGTICIWDLKSGALKAGPFIAHITSINSVAFSPDGQCIASRSSDHTIRVWDAESGALEAGPFTGHTESVNSVAFSPDGQCIASGSWDKTVRVWDVEFGALKVWPLRGHTDTVSSVAFSPDGQRIASGSKDKTIRVWDVKSGALKAGPFTGHTGWVNSVAFSPDGLRVASGSYDKTIRVWDVKSGTLKAGPFTGHTDIINSVAFSPDGLRVASGSDDKTIRIYDIKIPTALAEASTSNGFPHDSRLDQNGWMRNNSSSTLFWVPHAYRAGLWRPNNTAVIAEQSMQLDMTGFVHGEDWAQCHTTH